MYEDTHDSAVDQLKRADHLLHVTLKYSRTGDVMKNIIKRLLGTINSVLEEALYEAKEKKLISVIPKNPKDKIKEIQKIFPRDKKIKEYIALQNKLKDLNKANYSVREEYRKNITLVTDAGDINTEKLMEDYHKVREMVINLEKWKRNK